MAVIFPVVLILYEYCYLPKTARSGLIRRLAPFAGAAAAIALLALWSQAPEQGGGRVPWWGGSPLATFYTMLPVLMRYLGLVAWPHDLSAVYDIPVHVGLDSVVVLAGLGVLAVVLIGIALFRLNRQALFWYLLFFAGLLPVSQIVPLTTLMNDRYLYFPMLGAAGLVAIAVASGLRKGKLLARVVPVLTCLVLVAFGYSTFQRVSIWRNDIALWSDTALKSPRIADVWYNLGRSRQVRGELGEALDAYLRALVIQPFHPKAFDNMAVIFPGSPIFIQNRTSVVNDLVRNYPANLQGMFMLGHGTEEWRELSLHRDVFLKILRFSPASVPALFGLGKPVSASGFIARGRRIIFPPARPVPSAMKLITTGPVCWQSVAGPPNLLRCLEDWRLGMLLSRILYLQIVISQPLITTKAIPEF